MLHVATKIGLSALKTATKKVAHKAAEANSRNVEKIIITPKKVKKNIEWIKTSIIKRKTIKYLDY